MRSDIEMNDLSTKVTHEDKDIEDFEGERGDGEEIHRDHVSHVVLQKSLP